MEEVDSILMHTLKQIGCDVGTKIGDLSPVQIIRCVSRCFELIRPDLEIPPYDENVSMSGRYKVASHISQAITDLGYKEEIGCQSFLYPTEADTRKLLIFMMEKLPKDIDSEVGDKIESLLSRIAQENEFEATNNNAFTDTHSIEVSGIRLPASVDVDSLPKETLRFYASHLADVAFAKERAKFKKTEPVRPAPQLPPVLPPDEDEDFGDPDEPEVLEPAPQIIEKPKIAERPVPKPKPKPPIKEKPKSIDKEAEQKAEEEAEERAAAEAAEKLKAIHEESKAKALELLSKEKSLDGLDQNKSELEQELERMRAELEKRENALERQRKTQALLDGSDDALEKVKTAVENQVEKILNLSLKWEKHRQPLIEDIRNKQENTKTSVTAMQMEETRALKAELKEMGHEAKIKEDAFANLLTEFEKMPKDLNRSAYTKRISEIIGNIKKQKKEITKVLKDTKEIQKDINTLSGRLDRTFAVADELIFKDAEKDKNVAQSYKLLVAIHSDFSRIIKVLEDIGNSKRLLRDLDDKLELEKQKNVEGKLERLRADLGQMKHENQVLQAKLRDPALIKAAAMRRASEVQQEQVSA